MSGRRMGRCGGDRGRGYGRGLGRGGSLGRRAGAAWQGAGTAPQDDVTVLKARMEEFEKKLSDRDQ